MTVPYSALVSSAACATGRRHKTPIIARNTTDSVAAIRRAGVRVGRELVPAMTKIVREVKGGGGRREKDI
jgi:hypothetical protein